MIRYTTDDNAVIEAGRGTIVVPRADLDDLATLAATVPPEAAYNEDFPRHEQGPWAASGSSFGIALMHAAGTIYLSAEDWRTLQKGATTMNSKIIPDIEPDRVPARERCPYCNKTLDTSTEYHDCDAHNKRSKAQKLIQAALPKAQVFPMPNVDNTLLIKAGHPLLSMVTAVNISDSDQSLISAGNAAPLIKKLVFPRLLAFARENRAPDPQVTAERMWRDWYVGETE